MAQIAAQATPEDARLIIENPRQFDANPETNENMRRTVFSDNCQDRGMWGPLGGKNGTVSRLWLEEKKHSNAGGLSEFGLMTIIEPPEKEESAGS